MRPWTPAFAGATEKEGWEPLSGWRHYAALDAVSRHREVLVSLGFGVCVSFVEVPRGEPRQFLLRSRSRSRRYSATMEARISRVLVQGRPPISGLASKSAKRQDNDRRHCVYHNLGWCYKAPKEISTTLKME